MLKRIAPALMVCLSTFTMCQGRDPEALIRAGHIKQAKPVLEAKLKQNPKDANALWQMAWVKMDYNDLDNAIAMAQQATAADDKNADAHCMVAETMGTKAQKPDVGKFEKMRLARSIKQEAERAVELNP